MKEKQITLSGQPVIGKRERKKQQKEFVERMMSIFMPKLVMEGYEDVPIPQDIQNAILIERLLRAKTGEKSATETETLWYLSTFSLEHPLSHDWYRIFLYLFRTYCIRQKKELPDFVQEPIELEEYQETQLHDIRHWIYKKGMESRK